MSPSLNSRAGHGVPLGDGSYFDYLAPDVSGMTIHDYAWALAGNARFRGQTRNGSGDGERCLYSVCQHCVLLARHMLDDGHGAQAAFEGLMHESDEIAWPDFPTPVKPLMPPELHLLIATSRDAINAHFAVPRDHKRLVKEYDLRMLATEKRDLMPLTRADQWMLLADVQPFEDEIFPWPPIMAVQNFIHYFELLRAQMKRGSRDALMAPEPQRPFVDDVCACVACRSDMAGLAPCQREALS